MIKLERTEEPFGDNPDPNGFYVTGKRKIILQIP